MASLWTKFTDIFSRNKSGVVPQAPSGTGITKYLREDGTWAVPSGGGGGGSSTLADLEDVNLNNPSDGQILVHNGTTHKWENKAQGHNYSTTEQVVGTWIDGKPIYQRTWDLGENKNFNANTWTPVTEISSNDIKFIIQAKAIQDSGTVFEGMFATVSSQISPYYVSLNHARSSLITAQYIILSYTKTTD